MKHHQITASMAKDIAFKLGAELNNEEAEIFADGYNAAMQSFGNSEQLNSPVTPDGLNIRAVAALREAVRNQWLKSEDFADKVYWKSMHDIANEIVSAMLEAAPQQEVK